MLGVDKDIGEKLSPKKESKNNLKFYISSCSYSCFSDFIKKK